jgi:hypothetical protein
MISSRLPQNPYHLAQAEQFLFDCDSAGFTKEQMLDPQVMNVAAEVWMGDSHMLGTTAVTARVLGAASTSPQNVVTVQTMVDAGWNPNQIQRPDVYAAEAIRQSGGYPTPSEVRKLRLDENFVPRPGAWMPRNIVDDNGRQ